MEAYTYDKLNRLVKAKLSDGNEVSFAYNSYEEVVLAKDNDSEIAFTYDILGNVTSRTEGERKLQARRPLYHSVSKDSMRMRKQVCIITDSAIMTRRQVSTPSRTR